MVDRIFLKQCYIYTLTSSGESGICGTEMVWLGDSLLLTHTQEHSFILNTLSDNYTVILGKGERIAFGNLMVHIKMLLWIK